MISNAVRPTMPPLPSPDECHVVFYHVAEVHYTPAVTSLKMICTVTLRTMKTKRRSINLYPALDSFEAFELLLYASLSTRRRAASVVHAHANMWCLSLKFRYRRNRRLRTSFRSVL